jgi:imidazoleglycerol-phosphate dehydratase/histidinol-phosphatase
MKKVLFIDRDGTLIIEPPSDYQVDSLEKLEFLPGVFNQLKQISDLYNYELVIITNQDGLGTDSFPEDTFWPAQNKMLKAFSNEGIIFDDIIIDRTFEAENQATRKPGTALLQKYVLGKYDLKNSFVIGDRASDIQLAKNLGAKGVLIRNEDGIDKELEGSLALNCQSWLEIADFLAKENRSYEISRSTKETKITVELNLDGTGNAVIKTGLNFFDHMLAQIAKHGLVDLFIQADGDLEVDEHHTIEDTAICLGKCFKEAIGNKIGIERYGFALPMDDCEAQVLIDFGGRNWIEWDAKFQREQIGDVPTEMFFHFFKSFSDAAECNLNVRARGGNEHHKIEAIFKSFAKAIKMAVKQDKEKMVLPTTTGML